MRLLFRGCAVNNDAIKWATTVFLILLSNLVNVKAYATTNDFFVVSGQFGGDPWKNKVLVGEYKTIDKKIDGALVAQKRNGDDFYISYNAKDKTWYFQNSAFLNTRTNFAHFKCTRATSTPEECFNHALHSCRVWGTNSAWVNCKNVQIRKGDQKLRNKHRHEQQLRESFLKFSNHPQFIKVSGSFGDVWKDRELPHVWKLVDVQAPNLGGRPVYQRADGKDFYLNFYLPTKEWGFRNKAGLGKWSNYAYFTPEVETQSPVQITETTFSCKVYGKKGNTYEWRDCEKKNGDFTVRICVAEGHHDTPVASPCPGSGSARIPNREIQRPRVTTRPPQRTPRPSQPTRRPITARPTAPPTTEEVEVMHISDLVDLYVPIKYQTVPSESSFKDAQAYCKQSGANWRTELSCFTGLEVDINQVWLLTHSPWVNANKKPNGKWINNITKQEIQVQVGSPSHKCVIYQNYHLVSEDCNREHAMICERI